MAKTPTICERLRISRCYVRGPGDIGYDDRGEHDKYDGKPFGDVEVERREAAEAIEELVGALEEAEDKLLYAKAVMDDAGRRGPGEVADACVTEIRAILTKHRGEG